MDTYAIRQSFVLVYVPCLFLSLFHLCSTYGQKALVMTEIMSTGG